MSVVGNGRVRVRIYYIRNPEAYSALIGIRFFLDRELQWERRLAATDADRRRSRRDAAPTKKPKTNARLGMRYPSFLNLHFFRCPNGEIRIAFQNHTGIFTTESTENTELNSRSAHPCETNDEGG